MEKRPRPLALGYVALGFVATAAAGAAGAGLDGVLRLGLLLGLPLVVGAIGQLVGRAPRHLPHPAEVRVPTFRHAPLVALLLAFDLLPIGLGFPLGWVSLASGAPSLSIPRPGILLIGIVLVGFLSTIGWEWGLRARLYRPRAEAGSARGALLASVVAGTALGLPVLAPGFVVPDRAFLVGGLAVAALREAVSVRLYRRAGVMLSGAWRGLTIGLEAFVLADALAIWLPAASYVPTSPAFYALRAAGPFAAAVAAWIWCGRLDRRDAERRRHP